MYEIPGSIKQDLGTSGRINLNCTGPGDRTTCKAVYRIKVQGRIYKAYCSQTAVGSRILSTQLAVAAFVDP